MFLGKKVMTNIDNILKNRDITLLTKVHTVKAMVFPVVMYGCGASQVVLVVKNLPANAGDRCGFHPWVKEIPWRRKWQPTPVFLPGESHGQRRLTGYSP